MTMAYLMCIELVFPTEPNVENIVEVDYSLHESHSHWAIHWGIGKILNYLFEIEFKLINYQYKYRA
jgi:hypothetical protein